MSRVDFKYRKTRTVLLQCCKPGQSTYLLSLATATFTSGLVHSEMYSRRPTSARYGLELMSAYH